MTERHPVSLRLQSLLTLCLCFLFTGITACTVPLSPPVAFPPSKFPRAHSPGSGEVNVTAGYLADSFAGSAWLEVGVTEWLSMQAGASAGFGETEFFSGALGLAVYPLEDDTFHLGLMLGGGVGCGGRLDNLDGCGDLITYGGYTGLDLGIQLTSWFGLFQANRYQLTYMEQASTTHWGMHSLGFEITVGQLSLAADAGITYRFFHYWPEAKYEPLAKAGLTWRW